tara:strand:- start:423 stop:524 length:102 start_codon:yes stop_codon:yes gene_type:complete
MKEITIEEYEEILSSKESYTILMTKDGIYKEVE